MPWRFPGDQRRFRDVTMGSTVIMGRLTWESIGGRPLKGRRNLVVTSRRLPGVECYPSVRAALDAAAGEPVWVVGGARVYAEAMRWADVIDLTYVPVRIEDPRAVRFPEVPERDWEAGPLLEHELNPELRRRVYTRRSGRSA